MHRFSRLWGKSDAVTVHTIVWSWESVKNSLFALFLSFKKRTKNPFTCTVYLLIQIGPDLLGWFLFRMYACRSRLLTSLPSDSFNGQPRKSYCTAVEKKKDDYSSCALCGELCLYKGSLKILLSFVISRSAKHGSQTSSTPPHRYIYFLSLFLSFSRQFCCTKVHTYRPQI
jgi:hypothetical protein